MPHSHTGGENVVVLAGGQTGLTIIPSPTPLTSLNYFDGKFLRADDLMTEKRYVRRLVELSNVAGGSGVVHGFDTTLASGDSLAIGPGMAIDPAGQILLLPVETEVSITDLVDASRQSYRPSPAPRPTLPPRPADRLSSTAAVALARQPVETAVARMASSARPIADATPGPMARLATDRVADRIAVRTVTVSGAVATTPSGADFSDCADVVETPPAGETQANDLYLISIAHAEGLCGHEDVYGRLCDEACVTSTDRPFRVEGIVIRVTPLVLSTPLAISTAVALDRRHLRSRVASAYFADDALRVASLISRAGLAADTWCLGASLDGGSDVPIGVIARAGSTTVFLDAWTARRERMEAPPRRYWARRMAMRPWETYLAQILQFQCQLHDLLLVGTEPGGDDDPCRPQQDVIVETAKLLDDVSSHYASLLETTLQPAAAAVRDVAAPVELVSGGLARIADLRLRLQSALAGAFAGPRDRVLIQRGIVELPPAGYLPVIPGSSVSVNAQVRRLLGEGLDYRFCVVRPDFVPHALEEAQHMERISLLHGLDHPEDRPRVDVLVPDGEIVQATPTMVGHPLAVHVKVGFGSDPTKDVGPISTFSRMAAFGTAPVPTALVVDGAGHGEILPSGGLSFCMAGASQAPRAVRVTDFLGAMVGRARAGRTPQEVVAGLPTVPEAEHVEAISNPLFANRLRNLASLATDHLAATRLATPAFSAEAVARTPGDFATPLAAGEARSFLVWVSLRTGADLLSLPRFQSTTIELEAIVFSPAAKPSYARVNLAGTIRVDAVQPTSTGQTVAGTFAGTLRTREVANGGPLAEVFRPIDFPIRLEVTSDSGRPTGLKLSVGPPVGGMFLALQWTIAPLHVDVTGGQLTEGGPLPLFTATADDDPTVAQPANPLHAAAISTVNIIGPAIGDDGFAAAAQSALFPAAPPASPDLIVRATKDWVLFHRRRDITCGIETERPPLVPARRLQVFQLVQPDDIDAEKLRAIIGGSDAQDIAALKLQPVDVVEFAAGLSVITTDGEAIRKDWQSSSPSDLIQYAVIRTAPPGDGDDLAANRLAAYVQAVGQYTPLAPEFTSDVIAGLPGSLAVQGTDGAVIVVTRQVATTCMTVFRVDPKIAGDIKASVVDGEVIIEVGGQVAEARLAGTATFAADGAEIIDGADKIKSAFGEPVAAIVVVSNAGDDANAGSQALRKARGTVLLGLVSDATTEPTILEDKLAATDCPALGYIVMEPPAVETDCQRVFRTTDPAVIKRVQGLTSNKNALAFLEGADKTTDLGFARYLKGDSVLVPAPNPDNQTVLDRWRSEGGGSNEITLVLFREGDPPGGGAQDFHSKRVHFLWEFLDLPDRAIDFRQLGDPVPDGCSAIVVILAV